MPCSKLACMPYPKQLSDILKERAAWAGYEHAGSRHRHAWPHQGCPTSESTGGSPCEVGLLETCPFCIVSS